LKPHAACSDGGATQSYRSNRNSIFSRGDYKMHWPRSMSTCEMKLMRRNCAGRLSDHKRKLRQMDTPLMTYCLAAYRYSPISQITLQRTTALQDSLYCYFSIELFMATRRFLWHRINSHLCQAELPRASKTCVVAQNLGRIAVGHGSV
jgi:hypothetical protein